MKKSKKALIIMIVMLLVVIASLPFMFTDASASIKDNTVEVTNHKKIEIKVKEKSKNTYETLFIMGDSRSVGMSYIDDSTSHQYTAKVSEGYKYFNNNYEAVLEKATSKDAIIINFGINDLSNIDKYIELFNKIAKNTKAEIYFLTVNPVDEEKETKNGYTIKNKDIDTFNEKMIKGLDSKITVIDSNSILKEEGFDTTDGIHFTKDTYKKILSIIEKQFDNK